jgi:hypothetical protein
MFWSITIIKPELTSILKYRCPAVCLIFTALLFFNTGLFSQNRTENDSIILTRAENYTQVNGDQSPIQPEVPAYLPCDLIPPAFIDNDIYPRFYDSLKAKASKSLITKKLYDFLIVCSKPSPTRKITKPNDRDYVNSSGKIIRNIEIRQLNVFGTDINNPLLYSPRKINNLLNRTHTNTSEFIIRKNLLFESGDTLSDLTLSDNERILRQLPFLDDSRILIVPVSGDYADIVVVVRDVYSLGVSTDCFSLSKNSVSFYEKNILGMGHEFRVSIPYDSELSGSPGLGLSYTINNIFKSFLDLNLYYYNGLGKTTYGFNLERKLISSTTKYAGGISVRQLFTSEDLDTMPSPQPLKYNLQDYWLMRSFLLDKEKVIRVILGARYTNNNVFARPYILPDSYHSFQKYRMFLGSVSLSMQRFYKTNLIYGYGRTEDIPYGGMINLTAGNEINEFKKRFYAGLNISTAHSLKRLGYFYSSAGLSTFINEGRTEQGLLLLRTHYVSNMSYPGRFRMRNFIKIDYTRGFGRYSDEYLLFDRENGFSGFRNDSLRNARQRISVNLESVLFSPDKVYGFRFAYFAFADLGYLFDSNQSAGQGEILSSMGLGIRIRNDNLVLNTLQIRLGYFPNLPRFSKVTYFNVSGEQLLSPENFDPGPPSVTPYR